MTSTAADVSVEVDELSEEDLRRSIRCESLLYFPWEFRKFRAWRRNGDENAHRCFFPAAFRVRVTCFACGAVYRLFVCGTCRDRFRRGKRVSCRSCRREGDVRGTDS